MATDKTFKVVGVSNHEGEYKVRFANDIMRIKILAKNGHTDIRLAELPEPLTKYEAVLAIKDLDQYQDLASSSCISEWLDENRPKTATVTGPAVTRTSRPAAPKEVSQLEVPQVEEDDDVPF